MLKNTVMMQEKAILISDVSKYLNGHFTKYSTSYTLYKCESASLIDSSKLTDQKQPPEVFCKKGVLESFETFT